MDQTFSQDGEQVATTFFVFEPRLWLSSALTFARTHAAELACGALLAVMSAQMFAVIWRKSITVDEIVMIPSAYYHLADGDFQLVNEHPALPKLVAATPLLFVQPNEYVWTPTLQAPQPEDAEWARTITFWETNFNRFDSLSFWPRAAMIVLTVGLGVLIFLFSRTLFNSRTAVIAVALFSLEPTFLAHGRVVQTDAPAAFGYLLFFMALYSYTSANTWRRAVYLGAAAAIAILTKYSMLLVGLVLAPTLVVVWYRNSWRRRVPLQTIVIALSMLFVINAAYFFQHDTFNREDYDWIVSNFTSHGQAVAILIHSLTYILPKEFLLGICFQFLHNRVGHSASLLGMYSQMGWWYYFPVAMALKMTIPFLLLSVASFIWGSFRLIVRRSLKFLWLIGPSVVYLIFVLFSHINIGVRYMLPLFPFLIILSAWLLDQLFRARWQRLGMAVAAVALLWIGVEAVRAYPNHTSYMNQFASGAPHWWYLSDSNVEWGDDLRDLALWLKQRGERRVLDATLGGFGILRFYGIESGDGLSLQPYGPDQPRYLAIGASYMNGSTIPGGSPGSGRDTLDARVNFFKEYRYRQPEAIIGNSIYVFRMR